MISHTKLALGVSSAQFWGLILKDIYIKENILVPSDVDTAEFPTMAAPRVFVDDVNVFTYVARILNLMLKLVDLKNNCWYNIWPLLILLTQLGFFPQTFIKRVRRNIESL